MSKKPKWTMVPTEQERELASRVAAESRRRAACVQFARTSEQSDLGLAQWLAARKASALLLDPATAEITSTMAATRDPYGIHSEFRSEFDQVGREYFARDSKSHVWVWFGDLPDATHKALWKRIANPFVVGAGSTWEVRSSRQANHLILLPHNIDTHAFLLMRVVATGAEFVGWCWGAEGKRAGDWRTPASGRPAYFVPLNALRPGSELKQWLPELNCRPPTDRTRDTREPSGPS